MQRFRPFVQYFPATLFLLFLFIVVGVFMLPQQVEAIYCTTYAPNNYSWWDCDTNTDCGGGSFSFCDGGTCTFYESTGTVNCNSSGSYCSSACTRTYWSYDDTCYSASSGGGCNYGSATSGYPYTGADASCSPPYTVGSACTSAANACGTTASGTITDACTGACSASTPATPYTVGASCTRTNACGASNTGTITDACSGACSVSAPATPYTVGAACTAVANACGSTSSTITDACAGTCPIPANPSACTRCNNVNECNSGYECSGPGTCSVSAPADRDLSCRGGAGESISSGINTGAFPEYYGINNAWNNITCGPSATYSCPTGSTTKVYLSYSTETNYDFVKIYNGAGTEIASYSDSSGFTWKGPFLTDSLKFGFTSDGSIPGGTFDIWKIECIVPPDNTPPTVTVSADPASVTTTWQNTDATATVSCSDTSGCEASGNWKWLTRTTSIADCSSFALGDYTAYGAPLPVTSHIWYCATALDTVGNRGYSSPVEFKVDKTSPTSSITAPAAGSWQNANFTVSATDSDTGDSGLSTCYYGVYSDPAGWTVPSGSARTCGSVPTITVGSGNKCPDRGANKCQVQIYSRDTAGNQSAPDMRTFSYSPLTLTYPLTTWQRLWYATAGVSPAFTSGNFLGEGPNQSSEKFTDDWDGDPQIIAYNKYNNIGFKSSRTINSFVQGQGVIHVCSDDGIKLWKNNTLVLDEWRDSSCGGGTDFSSGIIKGDNTFRLDYYENTGNAKVEFTYWVQHGLGLTLNKSEYQYREDIALTAKYSGLDQRYPYQVYFTIDGANAAPGGAAPCNISAGALGDPRNNTIGTCSATLTEDMFVGGHTMCAYVRANDVDYNNDCVNFTVVGAEGTPPTVTINTVSNQWYPAGNPSFNLTATDNVALAQLLYQIDSYTNDTAGTPVTSNGSTSLTVSGASLTSNWKIKSSDADTIADSWDDLSQGSHTIYVKAIDTSGNCQGCDGTKSFTVKKDSLPPSSVPKLLGPGAASGRTKGSDGILNTTDDIPWFKAKDTPYSISIEDKEDKSAGIGKYSDLDMSTSGCYYYISDSVAGRFTSGNRDCNSTVQVKVGPPFDLTANCITEGENTCLLYVRSRDLAGNYAANTERWGYLSIDRTPPRAE